ncbi:hypothetical protein Tamer19_16550 [Cupriavidus sp. TA19]|uniref:phage major capsid protein n=1 Tax=unclassified Cupriavidus TaxID=2640874 RepID=UPI00272940C8|nr:phage major capsid protein [Cupriavidus sp. TA19]GLC92247.1 hypothetical protein Tamer19_16550 [Cupriavidus sp. TA19]
MKSILKELADSRAQLQAALDEGRDDDADRLMVEVRALQERAAPTITRPPIVKPNGPLQHSLRKASAATPLYKALASIARGHIDNDSPLAAAGKLYKGEAKVLELVDAIVRGVQSPAETGNAAWAGALTREIYAGFLRDLSEKSAAVALPFAHYDLKNGATVKIPYRKPDVAGALGLQGSWHREGAPIRVGAITLGQATLTGYTLAVISTYTNELLRMSAPNIETLCQQAMLDDTAKAIDVAFFGSAAAVAGLNPAGITNGIAAGDTAPSTGATPAAVTADLKGRIGALLGHGLGERAAWVMSTRNAVSLGMLLTATGVPQFPEMANGMLATYPYLSSRHVPDDVVFLLDLDSIALATDPPEFEASSFATLHEEADPAAVAPIIDEGVPPVPAAPVRSLYQTFASAQRMIWPITWLRLRAGSVQTITAVAW